MKDIEMLLTESVDDNQVWATKLGNPDKDGIPSFIEAELWRVENQDAPEDKREAKKIKTIRYVPIVSITE